MINHIIEMFSYTFLVKAIIIGILVSLCCALLGVVLVLKRYAMIGDGLSHVSFGTLSIALALNLMPLVFSIPIVIVVAFLLLRIKESSKIKTDSAIALLSTSSLAIGVCATSLKGGFNIDVCNYMFGSILALSKTDLVISAVLAIVIISVFIIFYNKIFAITFDEDSSKASGMNTYFYNALIAILTALCIVVGMNLMGSMLISSLIIFPALTAMQLFKTFKKVVFTASLVSMVCFLIGIYISYVYAIPTGASVVLANLFFFLFFHMMGRVIK